jgi:hypothetical protein
MEGIVRGAVRLFSFQGTGDFASFTDILFLACHLGPKYTDEPSEGSYCIVNGCHSCS